jgi:hypothetical protein
MALYKVMVDDNFHCQAPEDRREHGVYETLAQAVAACRELVDRSLGAEFRPGISAQALFARYTSFGEDPFIVVIDGVDEAARFSAWEYAEKRCSELCP